VERGVVDGRLAAVPLDTRRWFDRSQPQTLQIATWFLYINGFFALIDFLQEQNWIGAARVTRGGAGTLVGLLVIAAYAAGGFLMANERKAGYYVALAAAFAPFVLRFWAFSGYRLSLMTKLTGGDGHLLGFIFEVALCALLLHPQSRDHQRIWFR
jgi:hypothetical protein